LRHAAAERAGELDPAGGLDRLRRWVEDRLPPPRGRLATAAVWAFDLLVGRGGWVVGAFLVAMSAPWFVFPYRQLESMTLAAFYRLAASGRAEARVEGSGVLLVRHGEERSVWVEPYVLLAFEPASGRTASAGRTVRVRYVPHGGGLEPYHQEDLTPRLFDAQPTYPSGFRLRWVDGNTGTPGFEVRVRARDREPLDADDPYDDRTPLEQALLGLDRPLELLAGEWVQPAEVPLTAKVRYPPWRPQRVFVGDALDRLPPLHIENGLAALLISGLLCACFAGPFWWFGTRLLGASLPPRWRHLLVWLPLALLPLWGTRYLSWLDRLSPSGVDFGFLPRMMGTTQALPGAEPPEQPGDTVHRVDLAGSRFAPLLARVDLRRPPRALPDAGAAWREVGARFTRAAATLADDELARMFSTARTDAALSEDEPALAPALIEAARLASLDPARSPEVRETARGMLAALLARGWPALCTVAYQTKREAIAPLADHTHPELAAAAAAAFARVAAAVAARQRDWGTVCN
jgi:hypothetical protein